MTEIEATRTTTGEPTRARTKKPSRSAIRMLAIEPATTLEELLQLALSRSVNQILRQEVLVRDSDDPEDVHQLRVGIRRLHSDLRTFAPMLRQQPLRALRTDLKWLGASVGALRDCDVLSKRINSEVRALDHPDDRGVAVLKARLEDEHDTLHTALLEVLESTRHTAIVDSLTRLSDNPPVRSKSAHEASKRASLSAARFVEPPWDNLRDAVAALDAIPSDAALHSVRILTKRCRYAVEAVAPVLAEAAPFAKALADLQAVLGDHHDTVVAEEWLLAAAKEAPDSERIAYDLVFRERTTRARLRAAWPAVWDVAAAAELRSWLDDSTDSAKRHA
jgi:CHAD domain-containing protein